MIRRSYDCLISTVKCPILAIQQSYIKSWSTWLIYLVTRFVMRYEMHKWFHWLCSAICNYECMSCKIIRRWRQGMDEWFHPVEICVDIFIHPCPTPGTMLVSKNIPINTEPCCNSYHTDMPLFEPGVEVTNAPSFINVSEKIFDLEKVPLN